jgi:hypothetical protein
MNKYQFVIGRHNCYYYSLVKNASMLLANLKKAQGEDRNHEKFIMNNQRFLSIINQLRNNNSALEEYDETPHDTANNIVALGGWQFKISKTIYPLATINEILDGWKEQR